MTNQTRAHVALVAGRLVTRRTGNAIFDESRDLHLDLRRLDERSDLRPCPEERACGTPRSADGTNYCLIDRGEGRHICLRLYGRLFDGYDHGSSSYFSGYVAGNGVSVYDYSEADQFVYRI